MGVSAGRAGGYRGAALALSVVLSAAASSLFIQFASADGLGTLDFLRTALIAVSTLWLAWGASQSVIGLFYRQRVHDRALTGAPIRGRTAILVPVYNEDPIETFSRIAAMDASLAATNMGHLFDFAVLSDTRDASIAESEEKWFARLVASRNARGRMFYRRRKDNAGKKAGNIEDFITRSGAAYEFALILDADSLMEGETIVEMVRRMEAEPKLGLLQTLPAIVGARSRFGKAMQFAANFFSPVFARGIALMQGREGPFWGHNAMVRTRAFAASCGLPQLSGKPPFGGHVLSHDYVEAALLARAGWLVRLDPDLTGSYEEGPEDLIAFAKRDRRWCQGNLQHGRLLFAPGLRTWNRFIFLQGILAYLSSPVWALFLFLSLAAAHFTPPPDYFPEPYQLFPVFPDNQTSKAMALLVGIFGLLILPKLLILVRAIMSGDVRRFGGAVLAGMSVAAELLLSSLLAPLMLMFQTRSVIQVFLGLDGGWPPTRRDSAIVSLRDAWAATNWIVLTGVCCLTGAAYFLPEIVPWLLPVVVPMTVAPLLVSWSSHPETSALFRSPFEVSPSPVLLERERALLAWTGPQGIMEIVENKQAAGAHRHA
ncbi:glucans biosynthesis glucosyltransferase MdoH [Pelagibacterium xiamenense]|uniref:glucans biosynthesis glucosyltransferase MdoH n=1 Tax=Pelagibacterium xiamenense TaxID=2901140 RepID=UPI001E49441C|nr:glucans biosynthesis glucosyltransferase MdoH [Pelagibacterium xiamenense]MCD7059149.1 glucans biosynthesis glucosyltransferase MdoH [Pelagibacterium xiamenense]